MHTLSLTPLFRQSIGFDRFSDMFDAAFRGDDQASAYPPYNIEKLDEDQYRITMAVAGFKESDLTLTVQENQLTVQGRISEPANEKVSYLHKGIATRAFERKFSLADHVKVTNAGLADGLLKIELMREVPETSKPRLVPINGTKGARTIEAKKAN